ncbi:hypothetical protein [Okeania sp. SIO2C2]|uniref:hypothetical protein n=1 Tax=Okeania sp. SIO2C2 TaxID=2607787 RepID=UPI00257D8803|nr:hypothetical protein [Okeania sp. SIO2C2]
MAIYPYRSELNKNLGDLINFPVEVATKDSISASMPNDLSPTGLSGTDYDEVKVIIR